MKKIFYLANSRIPTEKAHGIQIMKTCEALSCAGADVTLVLPGRKNSIKDDPFEYYKVKNNFKISTFYTPDFVRYGKIGAFLSYFIFSFKILLKFYREDEIFYSRDELPVLFLSLFGKKTFWEAHIGKWNDLVSFTVKRVSGIIVISKGIKNYFIKNGVPEKKFLVSPDAVDLKKFSLNIGKKEARKKIGLSQDKKIIMYTGHLYGWKGADVLAESAKFFGDDVVFYFVGGTAGDIEKFKNKYEKIGGNIVVAGQKPHDDIPLYLHSADILIIPNSGKEDISRLYTSPMKLFEYMAAGRPIVVSDLPSMREILNEKNALFFIPDNFESLAESIKKILEDKNLSEKISSEARKDALNYSWEKRAEGIINFINDKR